jgi:hypothetical protein
MRLLFFLLLLTPSAFYAWKNADMPEFGKLHDDGIMFVSAKSIATGEGYRIISLPERPAATKYPILYPLYLSLIWRVNGNFPDNLTTGRWFSWPLLVLCLALAWVYWRDEKWVWIVVAILAISPYMILFGCGMFSEIFFLCWLLGVLIVGRREGLAMALLAGALAGLAYLSRTAGIALILSFPVYYLWRRESRRALAFAAGMLPFVIGWGLWSATHKFPAASTTLAYYTDYVKFQFLNVGLDNLAVVLWKNIDELLYSIGSLIVPQVVALLPVKILTQVIGIAMISGVVRLARRGIAVPYALFALVSSGMLVVWHFPPTERFVLPIFPLLAAGLVVELEHLGQMLRTAFRHKDVSQRIVAGVFALVIVAIFGGAFCLDLFVTLKAMPEQTSADRARLLETRETYAWIAQHLPPGAGVLSNDDPLLYLYTGHPGNYSPLLPRWWYAGDHEKVIGFLKDVVPYCRTRGFDYILATEFDVSRWGGELDAPDAERAIAENPLLERLYRAPSGATVYRIKQQSPGLRVYVKSQLKPLLLVAAPFPVLGIHRDK